MAIALAWADRALAGRRGAGPPAADPQEAREPSAGVGPGLAAAVGTSGRPWPATTEDPD